MQSEAHKRKRVDNMNEVDHLLEHRFETLSLEEKLEVKRLAPHHPRDIGINRCIFETMCEGDGIQRDIKRHTEQTIRLHV